MRRRHEPEGVGAEFRRQLVPLVVMSLLLWFVIGVLGVRLYEALELLWQ